MNNSILKQVSTYFLSEGITRILPFLFFPVLAVYLTVEDFGRVNNFQVFMGLIMPFIGLNLNTYYSVEFKREGKNELNLLSKITIVSTLVTILFLIILFFFDLRFISERLQIPYPWIVYGIFASLMQTIFLNVLARFRMLEQAKLFGIGNLIFSSITVLLSLIFVVLLKLEAIGRVLGISLASISLGLWAIWYIFRKTNLSFPKNNEFVSYLKFGLPMIPHSVAVWFKSSYEKLLITEYVSLNANGIYSFALTFASLLTMISAAFFTAFSPYIFKQLNSYSDELDLKYRKIEIVKISRYYLLSFILLSIVFYIGCLTAFKFDFFNKYKESLNYLHFLIFIQVLNSFYMIFAPFIFFKKKTKTLAYITFLTSGIHVLLMHFLVLKFQINGVLISSIISHIVLVGIVYAYVKRLYPMPWFSILKY